jgi:hypothetical protein
MTKYAAQLEHPDFLRSRQRWVPGISQGLPGVERITDETGFTGSKAIFHGHDSNYSVILSYFPMKRIMVISDTHEDLATIRMVGAYLRDARVDLVIHLGDYYSDTGLLEHEGHRLIKVPGTWDPHYYDPNIPNRRFITVAGWNIFLTHTPESHYNDLADDLKPETVMQSGQADLFLFGHTHRAEIRRRNGLIMINPGHMSCDENRGYPLTFALLDIDVQSVSASLWQLFHDDPFLRKQYDKSSLKPAENLRRSTKRERCITGEKGSQAANEEF